MRGLKALILALLLPATLPAQGPSRGFPPHGSFGHGRFDSINFENLNVVVSIPIKSVSARGLSTGFAPTHNSALWSPQWGGTLQFWRPPTSEYPFLGWRLTGNLPKISWVADLVSCDEQKSTYRISNFSYEEPNGTTHAFEGVHYYLEATSCNFSPVQQATGYATDSSGFVISASGNNVVATVWSPSGTKHTNDAGGKVYDTNGNYSEFRTVSGTPPYDEMIDSAGRVVLKVLKYVNYWEYEYRDSNGAIQKYTVNFQNFNVKTNFGCTNIVEYSQQNTPLPVSMVLPNNRTYVFTYEDTPSWPGRTTARLKKVTLPSGGSYEYIYPNTGNKGIECIAGSIVNLTKKIFDGTATHTWDYSRAYDTGTNTWKAKITPPVMSYDLTSNEATYSFHSQCTVQGCTNIVTERVYRGLESGQLARTVRTDFQSSWFTLGDTFQSITSSTRTLTLEGGQQSRVETDYNVNRQVTEARTYDWGPTAPGSLIQKTTNTYLVSQPYADRKIRNRVTQTTIRDGVGNIAARTDTAYDTTPLTCVSGASHHDDTNYGCGFTYRGNPTSITGYTNAGAASGPVAETRTYDSLGNLRSVTDPQSHTMSFDYVDNFTDGVSHSSYAYLTTTTYPTTAGIAHVERKQFFWDTGLAAAGCGQNYPAASGCTNGYSGPQPDYVKFTYDAFDRLLTTVRGDGGLTTVSYAETALPFKMTTTERIDSTQNLVTETTLDELARVKQERITSDPQGVVYTDTTYDAFGRKASVTNPYRSISDPTYGTTKWKYDSVGRVIRVIPPDGNEAGDTNVVKTDYVGNVTTVTDQAGKQRRSTADALGRLIQVDEPGGGGPATGSAGSATVNSVNPSGGVQEHNISAVAALGSVTLSGSLQSTQSQTQSPTQSTGSVTVSGSEQNAPGTPATAGTGSVNITGTEGLYIEEIYMGEECVHWVYPMEDPAYCDQWQSIYQYNYYYDNGGVSVTVNGATKSVNFAQGSTGNSIAVALRDAINADGGYPVTASVSGTYVYVSSKAAGAVSNYSLSVTSWTNDTAHFGGPSFVPVRSGATLTGGTNAGPTVYDSGTVSVNVNGVVATATFGQSSTASSIAADLRTTLNASSLLIAGGSGTTIALTSEASGAATNYPLSVSWTYNTGVFGSSSFTASKSGNNMTGGSDAAYTTIYDSGTVTITVNGVNKQVSYGQGSSTSTIASALAAAIANDGTYPATASANGATVNLSAGTAGTAGNGYALAASTTYNSGQFAGPSFSTSKSGNFLSGGVAGSIVYDSGTVTLTVATCTPFTVNYSNGSTRDSVATALRSAVNANVPCTVTASGSSTTISLTSDATGSGVNFAVSTSGTTNNSPPFGSPSFSLATSGMTGGADFIPGTLATPAITAYTYDTLDNLTCVEQRGNVSGTGCASAPANDATSPWRVRRFTYNSLSQLLSATNPESGAITYAYDNDGYLLTKTIPKPNQTVPTVTLATTFGYDALHRLTQKSFNDGVTPTQTLAYDTGSGYQVNMVGRLSKSCWEGSYVNCDWFGYDSMGRVARHEQGGGLWPSAIYTYNLAGGVTQLDYYEYYLARNRSVGYTYDTAGRVSRVKELSGSQKTYADNIAYHPHGAWSSMTLSNGAMTQSAAYSNRIQPTSKVVSDVTPAAAIMNFSYSFVDSNGKNNGNVVSMWDNVQVLNYGFQYDELNHLTRAETLNSASWGNIYGYDIWGNLRGKTQVPGKTNFEFFNQTPTYQNRFSGWSYDATGNLLNDGVHNYQFDPEGRIKCMDAGTNCSNPAASYIYSIEGRRVKRTASASATLYLHQGGSVLSEFSNPSQGGGTWLKDYIYLNGQLLASESATDGTRYHFNDHLGTPRVVTNADASWVMRHDYYPYGKEITPWSDGETHKFTGKERDAESGLDYFGARYYASSSGRFLSPDPENAGAKGDDPQSWNAYAYARNNPLLYIDPHGLDYWVSISGGTSFSVGTLGDLVTLTFTSGAILSGDANHGVIQICDGGFCRTIGSYFWYFGPVSRTQIFQDVSQRDIVANTAKMVAISAAIGVTGGAACYYLCPAAATVTTLGTSITLGSVPVLSNPRAQAIINSLFRLKDRLPGGTAGAVRYELRTGDLVGGRSHIQKAGDAITALDKILRTENLSLRDQQTIKSVMLDLQNSLKVK